MQPKRVSLRNNKRKNNRAASSVAKGRFNKESLQVAKHFMIEPERGKQYVAKAQQTKTTTTIILNSLVGPSSNQDQRKTIALS